MTTQQPTGLDAHTVGMNAWFAQSFDYHMKRHIASINRSFNNVKKSFNNVKTVFDEKDAEFDDHSQTIYELMLIIKHLASNDYSRGAVNQLLRNFKVKHDVKERLTISIIDERPKVRSSSRVTKSMDDQDQDQDQDQSLDRTLGIINSILTN